MYQCMHYMQCTHVYAFVHIFPMDEGFEVFGSHKSEESADVLLDSPEFSNYLVKMSWMKTPYPREIPFFLNVFNIQIPSICINRPDAESSD